MGGEWRGSGTVLVVDDDEVIRKLVCRLLEGWDFSVLTVPDGVRAIELFAESKDEIVCVILDSRMPRMNGEETFKRIRKMGSAVPVILISGYGESESTTEFEAEDLAGFLQKPFKAADLQRELCKALGGME